ncbi:hypothetical protein JIN85_14625 [Luteolibacter pohnpeiensis]|uniref:Uncharacterized protein n=1 Tax=Luteolibacter pohnpeiensis TaxID=454153 RepID=A0A934SED6_9BACT|nr:hypothetical protein [Luteolibacter pohnpeiensis]MBK1883653.1 hypothetical protein [Luteolibacter pohnpeiensis]
MKRIFFIVLLFAGCAPKTASVAPLPSPPAEAAPVTAPAKASREAVERADTKATQLASAAAEARADATAAREEAERLAKAKTATAEELDDLWKSMQKVEARNLFLESETKTLSAQLAEAHKLSAELESAATAKDAESAALRAQNEDLRAVAATYADKINAVQREASELKTKADKLAGEIRVYRWALWGIGGLIGLLGLAYVTLRWIAPLILKFVTP